MKKSKFFLLYFTLHFSILKKKNVYILYNLTEKQTVTHV